MSTPGAADVLVIDDDHDVRDSMADLLEHAGYHVGRAHSAEEALARLRAGYRPAVVLVNYEMPGMSGGDFIDECRADPALADIPVAVLSGFAGATLSEEDSRSFVSVTKPVDLTELVALVDSLAGQGSGAQ
jgi:CheY-like chemotaxis protein